MPLGTCEICSAERGWLHKHHLKPQCEGGTDADGIQWLCVNCHEDLHEGPMGGKSMQAKRNTPEARAKKAEAMRKQWADPEFRAKMEAKRSRQFTPEVRAKMAQGTKRAWEARTPEEKEAHSAKAGAARKGKGREAASRTQTAWWANATPEQRAARTAKHGEAMRRAWARKKSDASG
jgi:hypothetical protein